LHKIDVKIVGEGIPFKLELEKTEDQHVDFGVVRVDKDSTRTVSLINYSKKQLSITFENEDQLAELSKYYIDVIPQGVFTI
jgi:tRNA U54 and U55 pseudouridine synthase Pus10